MNNEEQTALRNNLVAEGAQLIELQDQLDELITKVGPVDWVLLRQQKETLAGMRAGNRITGEQVLTAEGLLSFLDAIQDRTVLAGEPEDEVFGQSSFERRREWINEVIPDCSPVRGDDWETPEYPNRYLLLIRSEGQVTEASDWPDLPSIAKVIDGTYPVPDDLDVIDLDTRETLRPERKTVAFSGQEKRIAVS